MNRGLHYFNTAGVFALATLCWVQWQGNRHVNLEAGALERTRLAQTARLEEQGLSIQNLTTDLDHFREQLRQTTTSLEDAEQRVAIVERENHRLAAERNQLQTNITQWTAAVAQRDERLKEATVQLQQAIDERNNAVARFNKLAAIHNGVVSNLNSRTAEFNSLVERFNALVASPRNGSSR